MHTLIVWLFWIALAVAVYTYVGYGVLLFLLVKWKERKGKRNDSTAPADGTYPPVTLLIAAYNEAEIVEAKMADCRALRYDPGKLKIVWVTDGSDDGTDERLAAYPEVICYHDPRRQGKTAAIERVMPFVDTPLVIYTDANTRLNPDACRRLAACFTDPRVGCAAGEKRVRSDERDGAASSGEGFYWKYESFLKELDSRLYSTVGAAGELYAIRTELFETLPAGTLLDDFMLSMRIAGKGYRIAYCKEAYAEESGSASIEEEQKRKVRIAAGGFQSVARLLPLLNPFRYPLLSFQYVSHRVLRWCVTPLLLFALLPLNALLAFWPESASWLWFYRALLAGQLLFYGLAWLGYLGRQRKIRRKLFYIPFYFLFMNVNAVRGVFYLWRNRHKGGRWEKAKRA